jgi:hypothetical protein
LHGWQVARRQAAPLVWTLWDRFEMDCLGLTLEDFLAEFKRQQGLEVLHISCQEPVIGIVDTMFWWEAGFFCKKKLNLFAKKEREIPVCSLSKSF